MSVSSADVRFPPDGGLLPVVVQEASTGEVLMLAWMDRTALERTLVEGRTVFWSRSRREYWAKGETSGHIQRVVDVATDCDGDAILVRVEQTGAACHTGTHSCFDTRQLWPVPGEGSVQ